MKTIAVLLIVFFLGTLSVCVDVSFRDIIDNAQEQSHRLHQRMENEFDGLREETSQHLSTIASTVLHILLNAIETVTAHSIRCAESESNETYVQLGRELSACALSVDKAITALIDGFFEALAEPQEVSVSLLSLVLEHVGRINGVDNHDQIAEELFETLRVVERNFTSESVTLLREKVSAIEMGNVTVAQIGQECVKKVVVQLEDLTC